MKTDAATLLADVARIAVQAGQAALVFYGRTAVDYKADDSPLTQADMASHQTIVSALRLLTPEIPILSEESSPAETDGRKAWRRFWLVDPLDGTKEFIKQTGQFTVNIALISGNAAELGVVHVPVTGVTYTGAAGEGAWVTRPGSDRQAISARRANLDRLTVVASKDHAGPRVQAFLERLAGAEIASMGSSLKFCMIAEGQADFYPRVVPTMEWDTGAAQCVIEAAGGQVTDLDGKRLLYNKDDLRNPSVMAFGDDSIDWVAFFAE